MSILFELLGELLFHPKVVRAQFYISLGLYPVAEYYYYQRRIDFAEVKKKIVRLQETDYSTKNNGKYVYISGNAVGLTSLTDSQCPTVSLPEGSISLIRKTQTYDPNSVPWRQTIREFSSPVQIGSFQLSKILENDVKKFVPTFTYYGLPEQLELTNWNLFTGKSSEWFIRKPDGWFYRVTNEGSITSPAEGDTRIRYDYIPSGRVSLIAQQDDHTLKDFPPEKLLASNIQPGQVSIENLADDKRNYFKWARNGTILWSSLCLIEVGAQKAKTIAAVTAVGWLSIRTLFLIESGKVLIPIGNGADNTLQVIKRS